MQTKRDIVLIPIKGLVSGSQMNNHCGIGYLVLVKGKYNLPEEDENNNDIEDINDEDCETESINDPSNNLINSSSITPQSPSLIAISNSMKEQHIESFNGISKEGIHKIVEDTTNDLTLSKESRVAKLYCLLVYHVFIDIICKHQCDYFGDNENIPDNLRCVSWLDGANAQLKLLTSEQMLEIENKLKISICKHSAARTAVEQAADCSPIFKLLRKLVKEMEIISPAQSVLVTRITNALDRLEKGDDNSHNKIR